MKNNRDITKKGIGTFVLVMMILAVFLATIFILVFNGKFELSNEQKDTSCESTGGVCVPHEECFSCQGKVSCQAKYATPCTDSNKGYVCCPAGDIL